jgi:16S rRNA (uracil1498-N3)-methyltransferase
MTARLFVPGEYSSAGECPLDPQQAHYLLRVRRLRNGDRVEVFDGNGRRFDAELIDAAHGRCSLQIGARLASAPESPLRITLVQALSGADKMDWTIEKAVELGVARIAPVIAERSVVRVDAARELRKHEHWRRLIVAACMQSGRDTLPTLESVTELGRWLGERASGEASRASGDPGSERRLLLTPPGEHSNERPGARPLSAWADDAANGPPVRDVTLLVGPESGFSDAEIKAANAAGFESVGLGARILRTETAGLAAIAALQLKFGDF